MAKMKVAVFAVVGYVDAAFAMIPLATKRHFAMRAFKPDGCGHNVPWIESPAQV